MMVLVFTSLTISVCLSIYMILILANIFFLILIVSAYRWFIVFF